MVERILSIIEFSDNDYEGYLITTTEQTIEFHIDNGQQCCESWGYFSTNDNLDDFIGAKLLNTYLTDDALKNIDVILGEDHECRVQFVNFETSKGKLQLAVYSSHNDYYAHEIRVISKQLTHKAWL
jgi:hypothetical protein